MSEPTPPDGTPPQSASDKLLQQAAARQRSSQLPPPDKAVSTPRAEPPPPPKEPPKPSAPGFTELLEKACMATVNAPGAFDSLKALPPAAGGSAFALSLLFGAALFGLNFGKVAASNPALAAGFEAWQGGVAVAAAFVVWSVLYLGFAGLVYALSRAMGGDGDFGKALVVAALASVAAPLAGAAAWLPGAWFVAAPVGAWVAACGLSTLMGANAWGARAASAVLCAGAMAVQYGLRTVAAEKMSHLQAAAAAYDTSQAATQLASDVQAMQRQMQTMQEQAALQPADAPGQSGLDLLRGPEGGSREPAAQTPAEMKQQAQQFTQQGQAMSANVLGMIESMEPLLSNPLITKSMTPSQKEDYRELQDTIKEIKASMKPGVRVTEAEQQKRMLKFQTLTMRIMSAASGVKPPDMPAEPPPGGKK